MIITRVVNETTVVLTLEGRLDSAWSEPTAVALDDAIRLGRARVELDLSAVTFISSVGIGVLLRASTKLRAVGGGLAVKSASVVVREMLRASKLEAMFALAPLVAVAHTNERSIGRGWNGSLVTLDATPGAQPTVFSRIDEGHLRVDASTLAIGHLALALDSDSARGLYGDGLAAGGTIALAPAHSPRPDCLAASDGHTIECMARTALVARGAFAFRGRFEGTSEQPVTLSSLALELLHAVGGPFAFVAIGECAGAFGAWAVLTQVYGVPSTEYWHYTSLFLVTLDPLNGLLKAACFGGAIGLISCYKGFSCAPGAAGVGRAATSAFVASFVAIVAINLLLVEFMNALTVWIYGGLPRVL